MQFTSIPMITGGLSFVAFVIACVLTWRLKGIRADQVILKGTDDDRKAEVIDALRNRFRLPVNKLKSDAVFELAKIELDRMAKKDRRLFIVVIVGMVLLAAICILSLRPTPIRAPEPPEAIVAVEYARLFGAVEVPILVQIQSTGAPICNKDFCRLRSEYSEPPAQKQPYEVRTADFDTEIGKFWSTQWPYRDALPISTKLWRKVVGDDMYGVRALSAVEKKLGVCMKELLTPWQYSTNIPPPPPECARQDTRKVGYLFLAIRNISDKHVTDVALSYQDISRLTSVADYLQSLSTDTHVIGTKQQTFAGLKPNQTALLLLTVYKKNGDGFEEKFLDDGILPRELSFKVGGVSQAMLVRSPRREKALVASLPIGWYLQ